MENIMHDLLQLQEGSDTTVGTTNSTSNYVSMIRISGKPILPPLMDDEKRQVMQNYKSKAIEKELKLKSKAISKTKQISSECISFSNIPLSCMSTYSRPASLDLKEKNPKKRFVLSKINSNESSKKLSKAPRCYEIMSSQSHTNQVKNCCRSSLEQRLASEDNIIMNSEINKYQQFPAIEEQVLEKYLDSDSDSKSERTKWSPLKTPESLNLLQIKLQSKRPTETDDDNVEMSLDESLETPETVTQSPNLMRQNSYTLLAPSPALLNFIESQKQEDFNQRSQSGRKTWNLTQAKKKWEPSGDAERGHSDNEYSNDEPELLLLSNKTFKSVDSVSGLLKSVTSEANEGKNFFQQALDYDSRTSPDSYSSKKNVPRLSKIKCKIKGKKTRSENSVPSSIKSVDKVPSDKKSVSSEGGPLGLVVPSTVNSELSELSDLLVKMKMDHERQRKELEEKQQSEMKELEIIFQRKEVALLSKVSNLPKRSIYSQSSRETAHREFDSQMMGDGNHNQMNTLAQLQSSRPHSVKDLHSQLYSNESDCGRRTRSVEFNQDTDLDVSFQSSDEVMQANFIAADSMSSLTSGSSAASSGDRQDAEPTAKQINACKKFQGISSEQFAKYNQAASKINAAVRGFLVRRLLQTAHVQGLITTLKDAITCATQLHTAPDIGDSDIDLMRRLSRQIEAAWDAVYSVFFNTDVAYRLQLIATDRERLKANTAKTPISSDINKKRISSATKKSLDRKKSGSVMSKSQTSNGFSRVRVCSKMTASYPSPYFTHKLK